MQTFEIKGLVISLHINNFTNTEQPG